MSHDPEGTLAGRRDRATPAMAPGERAARIPATPLDPDANATEMGAVLERLRAHIGGRSTEAPLAAFLGALTPPAPDGLDPRLVLPAGVHEAAPPSPAVRAARLLHRYNALLLADPDTLMHFTACRMYLLRPSAGLLVPFGIDPARLHAALDDTPRLEGTGDDDIAAALSDWHVHVLARTAPRYAPADMRTGLMAFGRLCGRVLSHAPLSDASGAAVRACLTRPLAGWGASLSELLRSDQEAWLARIGSPALDRAMGLPARAERPSASPE